jgi:hypothetical protein
MRWTGILRVLEVEHTHAPRGAAPLRTLAPSLCILPQPSQVHLVKVSLLDVGRPYSYMVTRLLAAHHSLVLGLRRQHEVLPGAGMRRSSATAEWRSLLGLGAQARLVEAALGGSYKPKEVWLTVESVSLGWESGKRREAALLLG